MYAWLNGLTFHRIVPNFVVQGGSPGASEYVGDARYMRGELGRTSNLRGAVGISTRGHDAGDAQFFFDLVDVPRLDHDYTVLASVTSGMDAVDKMLEGATIATIATVTIRRHFAIADLSRRPPRPSSPSSRRLPQSEQARKSQVHRGWQTQRAL